MNDADRRPPTPAARLRACLAQGQAIQVPGVYDGLSALLVERAGFPAAFLSGASLAFTRFGSPDLGLVDMGEVAECVRQIGACTQVPLIVDADTGFGNALSMQRTMRAFERAGAAAVQVEDQVAPKRCGHLAGKQVVPADEMVGKLKAALDARHDPDTLLIARTDALSVEGFDAAMDRAGRYLDAGADALFIEGLVELEQMRAAGAAFGQRVPLVHNLVEGGRSPVDTLAQLQALEFRIALHPALLVHAFAALAPRLLQRLREEGGNAGFRDQLLDLPRINALLGTQEMLDLATRYA